MKTDGVKGRRGVTGSARANREPDAADEEGTSDLQQRAQETAAAALLQSQDTTARAVRAAQEVAAEELRARNVEAAELLLDVLREAARTLIASQTAASEGLRVQNLEDAESLLKAQEEATRDLLVHQTALATVVRANELESAVRLLEVQEEAGRGLQASQEATALLVSSGDLSGAIGLVALQVEAAKRLLASQDLAAELLRAHNADMAIITALNAGLETRVQERTVELTRVNERLEAVSRAKSEFLASMSHELRTPLNSIVGFSGVLKKGFAGDLQPEQQKQVEMISRSGKHLLELVNELLDLAAIEAGQIMICKEPVAVSQVVGETVESLAPLADEAGLDLSFEVSPDAENIVTDRRRLRQLLVNLVGNGIKYTGSGCVEINVSREGENVVFVVKDTGCGIAVEELDRVFDQFYQVQSAGSAKPMGSGVGLSVSQQFAGLLGGTLRLESVLGEGSSFILSLPTGD